jgi:hypothetical protein
LEIPVESILDQDETESKTFQSNINELKDSMILNWQCNVQDDFVEALTKAKDETIRAKDETIAIQREAFQSLERIMKEFLSNQRI